MGLLNPVKTVADPRAYGGERKVPNPPAIAFLAILLIVGIVAVSGLYKNGPGEGSVEFNAATGEYEPQGEGIHYRLPIIEENTKYDTKVQVESITLDSVSKDQLSMPTTVTVAWHVQSSDLQGIRQNYGPLETVRERVVLPVIQDFGKACTKQFPSDELIERAGARQCMNENFTEEFADGFVVLDYVRVENVAIPQKILDRNEEQESENRLLEIAEIKRQRALVEKEQAIIQAEAEAESALIIGQAINSYGDGYLQLQLIQAWLEAGGPVPTYYGGGGYGPLPFLNIA